MSAKWMRIESNFVNHHKVKRLADQLGTSKPDAGWFIMRALSWMSQFCPTGQVAGHDRDSDAAALEDFCEWRGARGKMLAGFVAAGLIDETIEGGFEYHDWPEYQGKVTATAEKERERKAKYRAKKAEEEEARAAAVSRALSRGTSDGTNTGRPALRDVTGRDGTRRSSSYEDDGAAPPPTPASQFFDWFQAARVQGGWVREKPPDDLQEWFLSVGAELGDTPEGTRAALEVATRGYSRDEYWLKSALPWNGFVEQWSRHVRKAEQQSLPIGVLGSVS